MDETANEIKRLQGCINDLISVLALPAMWRGQNSTQILNTLLDVLVGMCDSATQSSRRGAPIVLITANECVCAPNTAASDERRGLERRCCAKRSR